MNDFTGYSLPESVALFCQPMGATVELWPEKCLQPRPIFSTFVLTSDTAVKVYGAAVTFYEKFDRSTLTEQELMSLEEPGANPLIPSASSPNKSTNCGLRSSKSICILSRWPFFDTFEKFLNFLHRLVLTSQSKPLHLPLESYISHFMVEVPFPSVQRPKILVQLCHDSDETVLISQPPEDLPLPLTGASFSQMLRNLGPDNCLNVLVLALTEQKILLHSLRADVLTGVTEAVTAIIFPFHWQCPYIPLCPLGLCDVLMAPLPFIVGVDSRYFDLFVPPIDVCCVDLDTNSIYLSESKRSLNLKSLPKKPTRVLRNTLDALFDRLINPQSTKANGREAYNTSTTKANRLSNDFKIDLVSEKDFEKQVDLEIQEAFVKFMASIMKGFRTFLKPITRAPTAGATDSSSLFDLQGFLRSRDKSYQRFYHVMMRTQLFARFIEERSFVSDKNTSLAFFDQCLDKIESAPDAELSPTLRLLDTDDTLKNDRTVFIPAPEVTPPPRDTEDGDNSGIPEYSYSHFGPLDVSLFHAHPEKCRLFSIAQDSQAETRKTSANGPSSPMSRRTKQEIRAALRVAQRHSESPMTWSKCLVSYVYSLWYIQLPAFIKVLGDQSSTTESSLRMALEVLSRLQSLKIHPPDEICYRILMLLCGEYSEPVLAVKVLFQMRQHKVIPNAITYGYYNKAVLESTWSTGETTATLLWTRLRNVIAGASQFKKMGQLRRERTETDSDSVKGEVSINQSQETNQSSKKAKSLAHFNPIDLRNVRLRTGSIVTANSAGSTSCFKNFNSAAGVLMTSDDLNDVFISPDIKSKCRRSLTKQLEAESDQQKEAKRQNYLRSYSFGNDVKIIKNLKEGPLKALKMELERNHQVVPEEDLEEVPSSMTTDSKSDLTSEHGSNGSFSPIKEAIGSIFSPESKVGSSFKSGMRFASKLSGSPSRVRASFSSSSTSKMPFLFRSKTLKEEDMKCMMPRSATLPAGVEGSLILSDEKDPEIAPETVTPSSSPWSKGLKSKHFDYVNSTIKSAANTMANRFSEIKSNFSTTTTPASNGGSSFLSQWANLVAEKLDSNFSLENDDESISSFDMNRKNSMNTSEDDLADYQRSRDGSLAANLPSAPIFELLEQHYTKPISEVKKGTPILEVEMSSCCRCYNCISLLFDEEIMEGWFPDDSNLNTQCVHCSCTFVPLLTILLKVSSSKNPQI